MHRVIKCIDRKQGGGFQGWGAWGVIVYWVCVGLQDEKVLQMMVVLVAQRCEWTCDTDVHLEMTKVVSRIHSVFPGGSEDKASACNVGDPGSIPGSGTRQTPLSFPRQEYWSGLPFPSPGDLPDPGIEPGSPAVEADALTSRSEGAHV